MIIEDAARSFPLQNTVVST